MKSVDPQPTRLTQLDAIRGIAALVVVFNHYIQTFPEATRQLVDIRGGAFNPDAWLTPWPWLRFTPLRLLVDGHAAVVIFFLLSGFVLALPVTQDSQPQFFPFIAKRICRVFIPFAATILVIAMALHIAPLQQNPLASNWFNNNITSLDNVSLTDHLLMTGFDMKLNPVMWSLVHEIRISAFLLVIFMAIRRFGALGTTLCSLLLSVIFTLGMSDSANGSWQSTAHFLWMFSVGAALSFHRETIKCFISCVRGDLVVALWLFAFGLLAIPFDRVWSDFLIGSGAVLLIVLSLRAGMVVSVLNSRIPIWLGRVSYSLYLIHWPMLFFVVSNDAMPLWAALTLTLITAEITHRTVESPAHKLGIFIGKRIRSQADNFISLER